MKKIGYTVLACMGLVFSGCQQKVASSEEMREVTVTIVPQQYFAEQIGGDYFTVHTMVPVGSSPESFDPPASSLVDLSQSEAYFQIGTLGFELAWMDKLRELSPKMQVFDMSQGMHLLGADHVCHHGHAHHHIHQAYDPHIWTTPRGARSIVRNMASAFSAIDTAHSGVYAERLATFELRLDTLEKQMHHLLDSVKQRTFVIYHPTLTYFAEEYGLRQLVIEHEGKEPSVNQLKQLVDEVKTSGAQVIFIQEEFDQKHAQAIAEATGLRVVPINPLAYDWDVELLKIAQALQ